MAYFMRFFGTDEAPTIASIASGIAKSDRRLHFGQLGDGSSPNQAELWFGENVATMNRIGVISIEQAGDEVFEDEIQEFVEFVEDGTGAVEDVLSVLRSARYIVGIQVLFGGRDAALVMDEFDALWTFLKSDHSGLSQADGEGFYLAKELILELP